MEHYDPKSGYSITAYAERLVGMSFQDVLDLAAVSDDVATVREGLAALSDRQMLRQGR